MIEPGQVAPDFALLDADGREVSLASLRGEWAVLFFYPRDNTPGCTSEACDFRDLDADYRGLGARVIGISPDGAASHDRFAAKHRLTYTLLSDPGGELAQRYGVSAEKRMYGRVSQGIARTTFLLDPEGVVRKVYRKVKVAGHAAGVLADLRAMTSK
ncbi:peroxiredoxin [Tundrisphaera sp. TA3]|uniref:peroxiredoxin n=1 Tax=Tundrisphaera sp. TA3 TaxID=3435775 RepID=UPI003EBA2244